MRSAHMKWAWSGRMPLSPLCSHRMMHLQAVTDLLMRRPKAREIDDVEGGDVVGVAAQVVLPEALLPEAEPIHVLVVVAERRVCQRRTLRAST